MPTNNRDYILTQRYLQLWLPRWSSSRKCDHGINARVGQSITGLVPSCTESGIVPSTYMATGLPLLGTWNL